MSTSSQSPVHVVVGVIVDADRRVLVAKRHLHSHQGGFWEFPGGKIEAGESVQRALAREIKEELGLEVLASLPLKKITHHYGDKSVLLDVYFVSSFSGEASGREGQEVKWQSLDTLRESDFPAANAKIIKILQSSRDQTITPEIFTLDE